MAGVPKNNAQRIGSINTSNFVPVPDFVLPALPEKLRAIDPKGCEKFTNEFNAAHAEWVRKVNIIQQEITAQFPLPS